MSGGRSGKRPPRGGPSRELVDAPARRRAVTDFGASLCVEAGAGTGKTKLLVDRYLAVVRSGRARCGQVVAITFTEKAAGEMKLRLRSEIDDLLAGEQLGDDERMRLTAARDELERAPISTIHSFASTILREHPIGAGIDPSFAQLDALETSLFLDECWETFLEGLSSPFDVMLQRLMRFGVRIDRIKEIALLAYDRRGERYVTNGFTGERPGAAEVRGNHDAPDTVYSRLRDLAGRLATYAAEHCIDDGDAGLRSIRDLAVALDALEDLSGEELEDALCAVPLPRRNAGNKGNWSPAESCAEQKRLIGEVRRILEEYRSSVADGLRDMLMVWLREFVDFTDGRKAAEGVLDFEDLLIKTRILLRNGDALRALRKRYRYLLVDEFQDTDPLQAEIVLLLAGGESDAGIEPGKLFVVGDPKQSIYRFRKADVEIYEEVKELLASAGSHIAITQNFRSVPAITGWVNDTFSSIIRRPATGRFQPDYEPIHPHRSGNGPALIQLDLEVGAGDTRVDDVRLREGDAIARVIRRLVSEGNEVGDRERGTDHRLSYGDIAVLYPGTTGIDNYEDPLRAEGIPYIVEGGKLYYTRQEIRDLAAALWAIEDPYDSLSLVAALRSPLFGFSDEEIFFYARAGGMLNYHDSNVPREFPDLAEAFELLDDLHLRRNERGPAATLATLIGRTKFRVLSILRPHGEQRVLNIDKAVQIARTFESGMHSFRRFAEWFKMQDALGAVESESPLVDESEDAVRLCTIHKSKGLQFPVVILANLVQRRIRPSSILLEHGARLAFKLGGDLKTSDFDDLNRRESERAEAETARLLYVAATRAADLLVIPRAERKGSYFELLEPHCAGIDAWRFSDLPPRRRESRPLVGRMTRSKRSRERAAEAKAKWMRDRLALIERAARRSCVVTPSGLERMAKGRAPDVEGAAADEALAVEREGTGAAFGMERISDGLDSDRARRMGSAFHRVMETVDLSGKEDIAPVVAAVAGEFGIAAARDELANLTRRALAGDVLRRAARASRVLREVPFTLTVEVPQVAADAPSTHYLEGRIDLLFEENGVWTAVDYKTDSITAGEVDARFEAYRTQGILYAAALMQLGIGLGGGVIFYFVRPDSSRRLEVETGIVGRGREIIGAALRTVFGRLK